MKDYNPDREGHTKHKFIVMNRLRNRMPHVPNHPELAYKQGGDRLMLSDEGLAREIQRDDDTVVVTRTRYPDPADRGHTYFFGSFGGVPWAKYDQFGRRIRDDESTREE